MLEASVSECERREDEKIQESGGHKAAEDYGRHRTFDLATGALAAESKWKQAERGD